MIPDSSYGQWTRKQIDFNGFSLSYLEGGKKSYSGDPVLFIHGWSISTEPYQDSLNALAQKYWVIVPDSPGSGRSQCALSLLSYQTYANCIVQLIERLNLDRFKLIGHSFGGGVALALAAAIPDQVSSLIVINSTGMPLISIPDLIQRRFAELPQQIAQLRWTICLKIIQAFGYNSIFHGQHLIEGAQIALYEDIRPWLKNIKSPCLVLWGERDYFTPIEIGYCIVEAVANSKLQIVPGRYHEWCIMQPETFAAIASKFFNQVELETQISYESSK
ncbi:MAG TPA: alpha/beta hydrolase [Coleofasciculaceae cyanobacterium]|jgi:pimeloyl-ACP methyl ester carboxylesterase